MSKLDGLILPDVDKPRQIADEVTATLCAMPPVRAIALFGSLAEGSADEWSDVDMLVACDDVETAKWAVAAVLCEAKSVLYYRPFSTAQQPSGRYWFVDETPFHKLDISFDSMEEYTALLRGGGRFGQQIIAREVFRRPGSDMPTVQVVQARPLVIGDREQEIGNYIYQSLRSLKRCFRGGEDTRGFESLQAAVKELSRDTVMSGGRIGELVHIVASTVENMLNGRRPGDT